MSSASTPTIGTLGEGCRIRILNSLAQAGQHEVYELAFQHQGSLDNAPHGPKAKEQLMVISGALKITSGANKALVHAGDTACYDASCPHAIAFAKTIQISNHSFPSRISNYGPCHGLELANSRPQRCQVLCQYNPPEKQWQPPGHYPLLSTRALSKVGTIAHGYHRSRRFCS